MNCLNKDMGSKLLDNFSKKYINSADNDVLFQEFINKYEKQSQVEDVNMDHVLKDFSVEEIVLCKRVTFKES
jgi:hypothetical protein